MVQNTPSISDTELEVLKVLWERGAGSVRDVQARLEGRGWAYTTVQTLLHRLRDKGFLRAKKVGRAHEYSAAVTRDELLSRQLGDLADRICDGATTPLVLSLFQGRRLSKREIRYFRDLLDDLEGPHGRTKRKDS